MSWLMRLDRVWDDVTKTDVDGSILPIDKGAHLPRAGDWFRLVPLSADEVRALLSGQGAEPGGDQ